jgi:hypothetical protein
VALERVVRAGHERSSKKVGKLRAGERIRILESVDEAASDPTGAPLPLSSPGIGPKILTGNRLRHMLLRGAFEPLA